MRKREGIKRERESGNEKRKGEREVVKMRKGVGQVKEEGERVRTWKVEKKRR